MGVNDINFFVKKAVQAITDAVSSVANEVSEKVKPQKSGTNEEDLVDAEKFEIDENLKEQIEYHDNGKPASIVGPIFDENNNIIGKYEAYYYENGNIADEQISEISPDGSYHKRAISYYENGQEAYYENKQFNKDGVLIFDYSEGHTIDGKKKYLYSVENNEYGEMTYTQDEEYDENGNLITSCYADYSREEPFELIKKLKYDKNNNLISDDLIFNGIYATRGSNYKLHSLKDNQVVIDASIGLPKLGELFASPNVTGRMTPYWTQNEFDEANAYSITNDSIDIRPKSDQIYIRPVINITSNAFITSGNGLQNNPLVLGGK